MNHHKKHILFLIITLIACNMETKTINKIEELLNYKFKQDVEETYYEVWKPNEELAYSYTIGKIKISREQYELLVHYLETENNFEHPKFKLNWKIPDEFDADWWNPKLESSPNTIYNSFENGWIQIKHENEYVYILQTIN